MRIAMAGASGRMGRRILELVEGSADLSVGAAFDRAELAGEKLVVGGREIVLRKDAVSAVADADLVIDFTEAQVCVSNIETFASAGKPAVVGTTGLSEGDREKLKLLASNVAIVFAPNMSVGVNLLFQLTSQVASVLGLDYNVEITEIHHNQKKDSPSGTAVRLAERAAEGLGLRYPEDIVYGREGLVGARPRKEIGMHSLRGGDVAGEHTVSFVGEGERIELTHRAHNRDTFARGALVAARFAARAKPGLYDMQDVLGLR